MATRPKTADVVIAGSVGLAVIALLMLGWQANHALARLSLPNAMTQDANSSPELLLVVAVTVCGIVAALLWALFYNSRACHRAETRLERMAHRLPGGFYVFRLADDGVSTYEFLTVNAANLLGVSRDQILQDPSVARRLVVPEDRERVNAALVQSHLSLSPMELDFRIRKPDGELRWVRTLAVPARTSSHDVVWNGHVFDITDIRSTEQALRDATLRLEDAQTVALLGDWTCDLATGALSWSPQVYELLRRDPKLGPPSLEETVAMVLEGPEPIAEAFELAQSTGALQSLETSMQLPDGSVVSFHVIVLPVSDGTGNVTGMRGTIQDITARKSLEEGLSLAKEAADATNRAKSAFLATMSHEIRTPLNGMLGLLELISLTPVNPEIRTALEAVRDSGQALQRIIDDILDFSKVEAGKLGIFPEPTRLQDLMQSVQRIYAGSAKSLGLDFRLHVDADINPVLMLDALRLRQILSNFISNAIKFTPEGSVELRVLSEGSDSTLECLRFEVVDTGIGIASAEQHMLFKEFEQAHSIANRYGGSGLGLSISRRLAELMGGHVSMSSNLGSGTTMTLHLVALIANPALSPRREQEIGAPEHLYGSASFQQKVAQPDEVCLEDPTSLPCEPATTDLSTLILVVDDHPINRMVMRQQINALGYAAEDVESGAAALQQWRTGKFSLVLSDLNMPGMSGYDLTRRIREAEAEVAGSRTPIIACSANAITGVMQECLDAGMDDYIAKPIQLLGLSEKLKRWLPSPIHPIQASASLQQATMDATNVDSESDAGTKTRRLAGNNEVAITQRALALFREVNDVDVMHLMEAIQQGDMATVTHFAHRIKGACGFINATGLASVSAMIEQAGRAGDLPGVAWLIDVFQLELEQLNATIDT
ncbi:MAG: response regulator [Thermomonas sp.]